MQLKILFFLLPFDSLTPTTINKGYLKLYLPKFEKAFCKMSNKPSKRGGSGESTAVLL